MDEKQKLEQKFVHYLFTQGEGEMSDLISMLKILSRDITIEDEYAFNQALFNEALLLGWIEVSVDNLRWISTDRLKLYVLSKWEESDFKKVVKSRRI